MLATVADLCAIEHEERCALGSWQDDLPAGHENKAGRVAKSIPALYVGVAVKLATQDWVKSRVLKILRKTLEGKRPDKAQWHDLSCRSPWGNQRRQWKTRHRTKRIKC